MKQKQLSRRTLLRGAGGAALALPMLEIMQPRKATAQTAAPPRRIIFVFQANGDEIATRFTATGETTFQLGEFLAPLEPYRNELLFLNGLDKKYGELPEDARADNHQQGGSALAPWMSGTGDYPIGGAETTIGHVLGPSVDYAIGQRVLDADPSVPHRHLVYRVGDRGNNIWNLHSHAGPIGEQNPVPPETDPYEAYARIFSFNAGDQAAQDALKKRILKKQSGLDLVLEEASSLTRRLGSDDKKKLELHMDSLRDIERTLAGGNGSAACVAIDLGEELDPYDDDNHVVLGELFFKISAMAFACDLTRSINFNWSGNTSNRVYRNLGLADGHHDISHLSDGPAFDSIRAVHRHLWEQNLKLYEALKAIPEGDGTVWDHTMIVHWNELGQGDSHTIRDNLVVLAGGAHGYFRPGRLVEYDNDAAFSDMLLMCFHYMGFSDLTLFGDERLSNGGPISGVT